MSKFLHIRFRWIRLAMFVALFTLSPIALENIYQDVTPYSHWFEYEEIVVLGAVIASDTTIDVYSYAEIKRTADIEWLDILYCRDSRNGFEFVNSNNTGKKYNKAISLPRMGYDTEIQQEVPIPWRYSTQGVLVKGDECYIESTIEVLLPYSDGKTQVVQSNYFKIK